MNVKLNTNAHFNSSGAQRWRTPTPLRRCHNIAKYRDAHTTRTSAQSTRTAPPEASELSGLRPLPGNAGLPVLGETLELLKDPFAFFKAGNKKYGNIWQTNVLFGKHVVVTKDTAVRKVLNSEHKFVESAWPAQYQTLLGDAFRGDKKRHQAHRKIMGMAFTQDAINSYIPKLEALIRSRLSSIASNDTSYFYSQCKIIALEVATLLLTGLSVDDDTTKYLHKQFATYLMGFKLTIPVAVPWTGYGKALKAKENIMNVLQKQFDLVAKAKKSRSKDPDLSERVSALETFMETRDDDGNRASAQDIKDMLLLTVFAGHETTGSSMSQMLRTLQLHPDVKEALRREQRALVEAHGPELTGPLLNQMPYLDAVIKESMRVRWTVFMVWRRALRDFELEGFKIPEGCRIICPIGLTAKQIPEFQADIGTFRPERWLEAEGGGKKTPEGYMPFGAGQRVCLGMPLAIAEMRCFMAIIARDYDWHLDAPEKDWALGFPGDGLPGKMWEIKS